MSPRRFALPGIRDLTKDQERARALPVEGQHLIVGGPGTGKSVVALLRARQLADHNIAYTFLVFNHLLKHASYALFGAGLQGETWMTWFAKEFKRNTGQFAPRTQKPNGFRDFDWEALTGASKDSYRVNGKSCLIIDEGQDMPRSFYESLTNLGFKNFFVVADQNQQITEDHSSRQDISETLAIEPQDVIELRRNYRNSHAIARLAREFYTGDPASPPPELPPTEGRIGIPALYSYRDDQIDSVARRIVLSWDKQPRWLIGVIAPNDAVRERYLAALREAVRKDPLDSGTPRIETFHRDHRPYVRFDQGGIIVINVQACKGLEFDFVVCADIDKHFISPQDPDVTKKRFYVMVARARQQLVMLSCKGGSTRIEEILPRDESILKREEI